MRKYIDKLIIAGKTEEACVLIDELWEKEAQAEKKIVADLNRRLEALEKSFELKE